MAKKWPAGIPYADISWKALTQDNLIRFQPERGRSKRRKASSKSVEGLSITLSLTGERFRLFRYWYKYELNEGAESFSFPDFVDDGSKERTAAFSKVPSYSKKGEDDYSVSAELEFLT